MLTFLYLSYLIPLNTKKNNKKISLICITSSSLETSCKNKLYDIIPILYIEGLNFARNLRGKHNIYYLSIEEQNKIFPEISFLSPSKRWESIGYIYAKKFFEPDIIFEYNGSGCVDQQIIEILNEVESGYFPNPNLFFTDSQNKNFNILGSVFGFLSENVSNGLQFNETYPYIIASNNENKFNFSTLQIIESSFIVNKHLEKKVL